MSDDSNSLANLKEESPCQRLLCSGFNGYADTRDIVSPPS